MIALRRNAAGTTPPLQPRKECDHTAIDLCSDNIAKAVCVSPTLLIPMRDPLFLEI